MNHLPLRLLNYSKDYLNPLMLSSLFRAEGAKAGTSYEYEVHENRLLLRNAYVALK
jgi:hypothetical protein